MGREAAPDDNPRAWARPDLEGDPWHEHWEPEGWADQRARMGGYGSDPGAPAEREARRRLGRREAVGFLVLMPIALVINLAAWHGLGATAIPAFFALGTLIGLIQVRAYGERSPAITAGMIALVLAWIAIVVAHAR